jgi:hypothetical protein
MLQAPEQQPRRQRSRCRFRTKPAAGPSLPALSNLSSLRADAGQTAAPRRLQKPTPPGVSRTSAGQQAPDGSPSKIRDRLPMIGSRSSELAQAAFPRRSQSPSSERPAIAERTTPFVLQPARSRRLPWRRCDSPDGVVGALGLTIAFAQLRARRSASARAIHHLRANARSACAFVRARSPSLACEFA